MDILGSGLHITRCLVVAIGVFIVGFAVVLFFNFKLGQEKDIRKTLNRMEVKIKEEDEVAIVHVLEYLWTNARSEKSKSKEPNTS